MDAIIAKIAAQNEKNVNTIVNFILKQLAATKFEARKYTIKELREIVFPTEEKEDEEAGDEADTEEGDDEECELPAGMTEGKKTKIEGLLEKGLEGKKINISKVTLVETPKGYVNGHFTGPDSMKEAVDWCAEMWPCEDEEEEASEKPAKKGSKKAKKSSDDEEEMPKGMTAARVAKIEALIEEGLDGKKINVTKGTPTGQVKKEFYAAGNFCGPKTMKEVVDWCDAKWPADEE